MSYLLQLIPTRAGYARENAALAGDGPPPRLDRMIVGGGTPLADPASATAANIGPVLATSVQSVRMVHSADAITGEAGFPEVGTYTITWAALLFDDGTPAAYGGLTAPFEKGDGWAYSLEWVLSRTGVGDLALTVNIVDVNALAENVAARALDSIERQTGGIVAAHVTPIGRAMHHVLRDGNPLMQLELFVPSQSLRAFEQMTATGLVAGDDSLDLANQTDTALDGDYVITGNGHTETVRVSKNLELGRRRLVGDLQYTYPTATISRTTWAVGTGEAVAAAGGVYYSRPLVLDANATQHRVIVRALTSEPPDVSLRVNAAYAAAVNISADYTAARLINIRPAADGSAGWLDYIYDFAVRWPDFDSDMHLRVLTPAAGRIRMMAVSSKFEALLSTAPGITVHESPDEASAIATSVVAGQTIGVRVAIEGLPPGGGALRNIVLRCNHQQIYGVIERTTTIPVNNNSQVRAVAMVPFIVPPARKLQFDAFGIGQLNARTPLGYCEVDVVLYTHDTLTLTGRGQCVIPAYVPEITVAGAGGPAIPGTSGNPGSPGEAAHVAVVSIRENGTLVTTAGYSWGVIPLGAQSFYINYQLASGEQRGGIAQYQSAGVYYVADWGWTVGTIDVGATPSTPATPATPGYAGADTVVHIPGADNVVFAGAAAGDTRPAEVSTVTRRLDLGADAIVVNYDVPPGGSLTIRW